MNNEDRFSKIQEGIECIFFATQRNNMKQIINTIKKYATEKIILIFLALTISGEIILSYSNYLFSKISNLPSTLDVSFFYGTDFANNFFSQIPPEGIAHYLYKFTTIDTIFPLIYSIFFALLISYIFKNKNIKNSKLEYLILFPFILMIFDYLENILTIILMNSLKIDQGLIYLLAISSSIKWGGAFIGIIILIGLLFIKNKTKDFKAK